MSNRRARRHRPFFVGLNRGSLNRGPNVCGFIEGLLWDGVEIPSSSSTPDFVDYCIIPLSRLRVFFPKWLFQKGRWYEADLNPTFQQSICTVP